MTNERQIEIANLVLAVKDIPNLYISSTVGNTNTQVYAHDLRDENSRCCIYTQNADLVQYTDDKISYIYDPDFSEAEEHLRKIIQEGNDGLHSR